MRAEDLSHPTSPHIAVVQRQRQQRLATARTRRGSSETTWAGLIVKGFRQTPAVPRSRRALTVRRAELARAGGTSDAREAHGVPVAAAAAAPEERRELHLSQGDSDLGQGSSTARRALRAAGSA